MNDLILKLKNNILKYFLLKIIYTNNYINDSIFKNNEF